MNIFKHIAVVVTGSTTFWYLIGAFVSASFDISLWDNRFDIAVCFVFTIAVLLFAGLDCIKKW